MTSRAYVYDDDEWWTCTLALEYLLQEHSHFPSVELYSLINPEADPHHKYHGFQSARINVLDQTTHVLQSGTYVFVITINRHVLSVRTRWVS